MSDAPAKPIIFISYAHADEPEKPAEGEIKWLTFVQRYLQPAVKHGIFDIFVDEHLHGGANLKPEIERKLRACDVFLLLVSANSTASDYIIDTEIEITRNRESKGEDVVFYSLLLTPTPKVALDKLKGKVIRPRDAKPLSGFPYGERIQVMTDIADEIAEIAEDIASRRPPTPAPPPLPDYVHLTGLPETPYEHLVGRDAELQRLDAAWADPEVSIVSLVAEGGAGKSALVNEWLKRLQADSYRGAELVLGWSFYSQGSKERATSSETFLNWALAKLGVTVTTASASAKGEAIAEALERRRVLLVLDGVEPLQHGLDTQLGELKDQGLRGLLRRLASAAPSPAHGLVALSSRLPVKDIARWKEGSSPVIDVEALSDEAGASLLRDNGVWGTDKELRAAAQDFGGHPLALGLLASFLKETQMGDVRRRDHIRDLVSKDEDNPRHDHARRVVLSYEEEWLTGEPVARAIMHMVGLFDRPASGDCLAALRRAPVIEGLTDAIVGLDESAWQRAVTRLREVRLLAPDDTSAPDALDTHPLVREWFDERLRQANEAAWKVAHGRLYEHLRDTTQEGDTPTLEHLAPLYQAISHGCRASRHQEALEDVYVDRICRRLPNGEIEFYSRTKLGALDSDLAAISWFFTDPYATPVVSLTAPDRSWVLHEAAFRLRAQGRLAESLPAVRTAFATANDAEDWINAAIAASNLSESHLLGGEIAQAVASAERSVTIADRSGNDFQMMAGRVILADAFHAAGRRDEASQAFADAERRQKQRGPAYRFLSSLGGYRYCDLLLGSGHYAAAYARASDTIASAQQNGLLLDTALDTLTLGRAGLGLALDTVVVAEPPAMKTSDDVRAACFHLNDAVDGLRAAGAAEFNPLGTLGRAASRRSIGDWKGAARDLDEVEEIAEPGPMRLFLCDAALERARLAFARIEAFAPLNGLIDDAPPKPEPPDEAERAHLHEEAARQLGIAAGLIETCGYHKRDEELAELQAVFRGERRFADLPPRV